MKCLLIGASCNDTMGRMHSDAQFAGRNSVSVTTLWLLVPLTLLLRLISNLLNYMALQGNRSGRSLVFCMAVPFEQTW